MNMRFIAAAVIAAAAGSTQAALLSFSSSTAGGSWTFQGTGNSVTDATGPNAPITLDIDDNNGVLPTLSVSTQFDASYTITFAGTTNLGGGALAYNYTASGSFTFQDMVSGTTLLTVNFQNCLFTARGNSTSWFTTGSLQGDEGNGASVNMIWSGASLPGYGLTPGALPTPRGFAFDMSALNTSGAIPYSGQNPGVGLTNNLPNAHWFSEGSFSASTGVPAPGSLALLGVAGLTAARRRRR
jgi:MYXO-CTERM domain-containing protein